MMMHRPANVKHTYKLLYISWIRNFISLNSGISYNKYKICRSSVTEGPTSESCCTNCYDLSFHYCQANYDCENSTKSAERNTMSLDVQWYYKELVCFLLTSFTFQNVYTIFPDCLMSPQKVLILKLSDDFIVKFQTTSKTAS
jgi:hypothetical protein